VTYSFLLSLFFLAVPELSVENEPETMEGLAEVIFHSATELFNLKYKENITKLFQGLTGKCILM
jgi:hypothetical protein